MNKFRKPYVTCIFALVLLFTSCSQYENQNEEVIDSSLSAKETSSLANYVEEHIKMASKLYELIEYETDINVELLKDSTKNIDFDQLDSVLENANFIEFRKIAGLLKKINANNSQFIESNPDFDIQKLESIIINELDKMLVTKSSQTESDSCLDRYKVAKGRCFRNLTIALTIAGGAAFFTAGLGGAFGAAPAYRGRFTGDRG
jgi:hypothetical protein